ncbi:MAG: hypothetical protein MK135_15870 [Polyangiaceae bacterium]|nr:hypothetical protein [Polyangiaceae bacterium]
MPFSAADNSRYAIRGSLTPSEVEELRTVQTLDTLQFSEPVESETLSLLNDEFFPHRPDVTFRVFGHYSQPCDLKFLELIPNVRRFSADCLQTAENVEAISGLPNLEALNVQVYDLKSFEFLADVSPNLTELGLGDTKSKRPSIEHVGRFTKLVTFGNAGHLKGLEALANCQALERISLSGLSNPDLGCLASLSNLWSLEVLLGGSEDMSKIRELERLKHLELSWVKRLADLSFLSDCVSLQKLTVNRLKQVQRLPDLSKLANLRALSLAVLKNLESVDEVASAPALEWLGGDELGKLEPEEFQKVLSSQSLKCATVYFGSEKKNSAFDKLAELNGVSTEVGSVRFEYK